MKKRLLVLILIVCCCLVGCGENNGGDDHGDTPGNQSPIAACNADPATGVAPLDVNFDASASNDPDGTIASYAWDFDDGETGSGATTSHTYVSAGTYTITLTVTDDDGASDTDSVSITVVHMVTTPDVVGMSQANAEAAIVAENLAVGTVNTANSETIPLGNVISQNPSAGSSVVQGSAVDLVVSSGPAGSQLPPDPADVAPELDPTVAAQMVSAVSFLYTGSDPIQTGVASDTIKPDRVAVIRGKVMTRDDNPLPGVTISILNHPEYGETLSREDGMFDLAVNGGAYLVVNYVKAGYLTSQRQIDVPWQDWVWVPDVVLIALDPAVTPVNLDQVSEDFVVAQGSDVSDDRGIRQSTLLFPKGVQAELEMPDGSTQSISSLDVRITEYSIGSNGPEAMPAILPPGIGYTYCAELSVDEAIAAGAETVNFSQPLYNYVENFLGFAVGEDVRPGLRGRGKQDGGQSRRRKRAAQRVEQRAIRTDLGRGVAEIQISGSASPRLRAARSASRGRGSSGD